MKQRTWAVVLLVCLLVLLGCDASTAATQTDQTTPAPIVPPTPTPNLSTDTGVIAYAKNILASLGLHGTITHVDNTGGMHITDYIPSGHFLSNSAAKDDIEEDSFDIEHSLWTSRLSQREQAIYVSIQSDLVDHYGKSSRGDIARVGLSSGTEQKFNWSGLYAQPSWDNKIYDIQWLLPAIANS